jgi:hypothetical protein
VTPLSRGMGGAACTIKELRSMAIQVQWENYLKTTPLLV